MNTIKICKKNATCKWKKVLDKVLLLISLDEITDLQYIVDKRTFDKVARIRQQVVDLVDEIVAINSEEE